MTSPQDRRFTIAHTWDGALLPPGEVSALHLHWTAQALVLELEAPFAGDPPPPGPPGPTWALWEHEVVELFVVGPDEAYTEVELGPYGHHLVLQLRGRRRIVARELPLDLQVERRGASWTARALLDRALLPPRPWRGNAYRIAGLGAARRYQAHAPVPGPTPDFHRLEAFATWDAAT